MDVARTAGAAGRTPASVAVGPQAASPLPARAGTAAILRGCRRRARPRLGVASEGAATTRGSSTKPQEARRPTSSRSRTGSAARLQALAGAGITACIHTRRGPWSGLAGPTIVTTGTASGKSLCFQLPTLEVLSPTRRPRPVPLSDQGAGPGSGASAARFGLHKAVRPAIYDGDTPRQSARRSVSAPT